MQKYHVIMGAISAFNINDIQHFVSGKTGLVSREDPRWQRLCYKLESSGVGIYWVPSVNTLEDMTRQMEEKIRKAPRPPSPPKPPLH